MPKKQQQHSSFIADHVRDIPRSGIRDFFDIVQSMDNVVSLGIGEPGFVTPWHIREASIFALERGRTGYTSNYGLIKLRRSISRYVATNHNVTYNPDNEILVTVGVSEAMDIALRSIINPGDEILSTTNPATSPTIPASISATAFPKLFPRAPRTSSPSPLPTSPPPSPSAVRRSSSVSPPTRPAQSSTVRNSIRSPCSA